LQVEQAKALALIADWYVVQQLYKARAQWRQDRVVFCAYRWTRLLISSIELQRVSDTLNEGGVI
jgi:hypothetical protein